MNLVVLHGVLNRPAESRVLESGSVLMSLDVTIREGVAQTLTVPVAWFDPPAGAMTLSEGDEVYVLGTVRRRFWRGRTAGPPVSSTTEVVAEKVLPASQGKRVDKLFTEARARLEAPAAATKG